MAVNSSSKLRDILQDERAVAIINEYKPGFIDSPDLGPVAGMKIKSLLKFPQAGLDKATIQEICDRLDALDA